MAGFALLVMVCLAHGGRPAGAATPPSGSVIVLVDTTTTEASTTTVPASTTTLVPTTTTTTVPATTTTHPATTTTTHPTTTTSSSTTSTSTTTTVPPIQPTASKVPWALIFLVVALVGAIVLVALVLRSRNKGATMDAWRRQTLPSVTDARLAREALLSASATSEDPELRGAIEVQVDRAATALERAGATAPEPAPGGAATTAAGALRGLAFAIEADRLLHNGATAPTGVQLAQADEARRARDAELQAALARLESHVAPPAKG